MNTDLAWRFDETTIDATLVLPPGSGPFPAVAMAAGSGPTDRNWNSPLLPGSNGSARLLAEALAASGFASLRYDKRVVGPHARENLQELRGKLSMQSHRDEFASAVRTLADRPDIRADQLFALANSEGTLHALNYQIHEPALPLAGLVLIAPPGRRVGEVARSQLAAQARGVPNGAALLTLWDAAIARFLANQPMAPDPALPAGVQLLLQSLETPTNLPFARELWTTDGSSLLAQVRVPALVIIGKKDIQVDWEVDGEALQRAAARHPNVTFVFPDDANHVLKHEPRPRAELNQSTLLTDYNRADARLDPRAWDEIISWLIAHVAAQ